MKDFLWMLYLALTLVLTFWNIVRAVSELILRKRVQNYSILCDLITCIMWAIWYMYFLH
jgi:hypothetical protein